MPPVASLRQVSQEVAFKFGMAAIENGAGGLCVYSSYQHNNDPQRLKILLGRMRWKPEYLPLEPM